MIFVTHRVVIFLTDDFFDESSSSEKSPTLAFFSLLFFTEPARVIMVNGERILSNGNFSGRKEQGRQDVQSINDVASDPLGDIFQDKAAGGEHL